MFGELNLWMTGGGLALGLFFGVVCQLSRFCVVAAVSNLVLMRDFRQLHAYLAALGIALAGTGLLEWGQWVDIAGSSYRNSVLNWAGALGGGLIFGIGAMLAGGCATRTLIRTAEGNIGALVTLIAFALMAMATLYGVLDPLRAWTARMTSVPLNPAETSFAGLVGIPQWLFALALVLICWFAILRLGDWREHRGLIVAGGLIGLSIILGWWVTGILGQDDFTQLAPTSLAIAGPLARGITYLTMGQVVGTGFSLFFILGVLLGALASALGSRTFRWTAPASNRVGAYLVGGGLMGVGAILAGGCNVGQGITGFATLATQSFIAVTGILLGMLLVLWRMQREKLCRVT